MTVKKSIYQDIVIVKIIYHNKIIDYLLWKLIIIKWFKIIVREKL